MRPTLTAYIVNHQTRELVAAVRTHDLLSDEPADTGSPNDWTERVIDASDVIESERGGRELKAIKLELRFPRTLLLMLCLAVMLR